MELIPRLLVFWPGNEASHPQFLSLSRFILCTICTQRTIHVLPDTKFLQYSLIHTQQPPPSHFTHSHSTSYPTCTSSTLPSAHIPPTSHTPLPPHTHPSHLTHTTLSLNTHHLLTPHTSLPPHTRQFLTQHISLPPHTHHPLHTDVQRSSGETRHSFSERSRTTVPKPRGTYPLPQ